MCVAQYSLGDATYFYVDFAERENGHFMSTKEQMMAALLDEIDGYFRSFVYLRDLILVEEHLSKSNTIQETAPNFSLIAECALVDSYLLCLMKLYDKSTSAKTIPALIQKCKKQSHLFSSPSEVLTQLVKFENTLHNDKYLKNATDVLRFRRDKIHVHNDEKYFGNRISHDNSKLHFFEVEFLVAFTESVLCFLWNQLTSEPHREPKYNQDLGKLL